MKNFKIIIIIFLFEIFIFWDPFRLIIWSPYLNIGVTLKIFWNLYLEPQNLVEPKFGCVFAEANLALLRRGGVNAALLSWKL